MSARKRQKNLMGEASPTRAPTSFEFWTTIKDLSTAEDIECALDKGRISWDDLYEFVNANWWVGSDIVTSMTLERIQLERANSIELLLPPMYSVALQALHQAHAFGRSGALKELTKKRGKRGYGPKRRWWRAYQAKRSCQREYLLLVPTIQGYAEIQAQGQKVTAQVIENVDPQHLYPYKGKYVVYLQDRERPDVIDRSRNAHKCIRLATSAIRESRLETEDVGGSTKYVFRAGGTLFKFRQLQDSQDRQWVGCVMSVNDPSLEDRMAIQVYPHLYPN